MERTSAITDSIFDRFDKLSKPSSVFGWEPCSQTTKINKEDIICEGILKELEESDSSLYPEKQYAVTANELIKFGVFFVYDIN